MVRVEMSQDWLRQGGSLVLGTAPGEDVARAVDTVIATAGTFRVLRHGASETGEGRPLCGLAGLLSSVDTADLRRLPDIHHTTLTRTASGAAPAGELPEQALGEAMLALLRVLAHSGAILLVVENAQWLDRVSTAVLEYVASRVGRLAVQAAVTVGTTDDAIRRARRLCPPPLLVILR